MSERSQRDFPFKKRKLYYCNSFSNSDGGSSDGICSSPTKDLNRDASGYSLASSGGLLSSSETLPTVKNMHIIHSHYLHMLVCMHFQF